MVPLRRICPASRVLYEHMFAMMDVTEITAWVALLKLADQPWHQYSELAEELGSATELLRHRPRPDPELTLFDERDAREIPDLRPIRADVERWLEEGIGIVSVLDQEYPSNLRTIHNRPPLLFVRGSVLPEDVRAIAVVGTRRASESGLGTAELFSRSFAAAGFTVVSGLAAGIDTAAHQAALSAEHRTIAVIGTGIRRSYPAQNSALQEQIAHKGAVVSQFWPDAPPTKASFPMRNVVMSGIAQATVVIEAPHTSGARHQARMALEHGRPVFFTKNLLTQTWARAFSERPGVYVVTTPDEVIDRLERLRTLETLSA
jgi:DNA processing protein